MGPCEYQWVWNYMQFVSKQNILEIAYVNILELLT